MRSVVSTLRARRLGRARARVTAATAALLSLAPGLVAAQQPASPPPSSSSSSSSSSSPSSGPGAASADPNAPSALQPSFDVLLPDPEPVETNKQGGRTEEPSSSEFDAADRVLSAAKQVTTVQEAPAIITVIRSDEIQARGYRTLSHVLETVPGWLNASNLGQHLSMPLVRGTAQAALLLRDGVSLFEPTLNAAQFTRAQPLETLKAIEVVTGPGGVLWGANSFLGIINLVRNVTPEDEVKKKFRRPCNPLPIRDIGAERFSSPRGRIATI
ncbi:MAG: Plug domain-containing protein [Polyangia bacterium]